MAQVGQHVVVHYTGTLEDGTVFDSSYNRNQPLEFTLGGGQMITGFDKAVQGLEIGETCKVTLPPAEAYGEYLQEAVQKLPADKIANADKLPVGGKISFKDPAGNPFVATILKVEDGFVYIDFNHELAGKTLTFEITLVDAYDA